MGVITVAFTTTNGLEAVSEIVVIFETTQDELQRPGDAMTSTNDQSPLPTASVTAPSKATASYYSYRFPDFSTTTNLGPLTTSFSFPSQCYTELIDMNRDGLGPSGAWKTLGCAMSTCCPFGRFYTEEWAWMTSYYSPGICPSDYQSCAPPTQSGLRLTAREGERIVFCCPNNCICPNDEDMPLEAPGACGSRLTSSSKTTVYTVMNNFRDQQFDHLEAYAFEPGFTQELQIAWPIQIRIPETSTASGTLTATASGVLESGHASPKSDLSTGAIVGIAFGGFFSIFVVCFVAYLLLRRRKNIREAQPMPAPEIRETQLETPYSPAPPYSLSWKPITRNTNSSEGTPHEMSSTFPNAILELPDRQ